MDSFRNRLLRAARLLYLRGVARGDRTVGDAGRYDRLTYQELLGAMRSNIVDYKQERRLRQLLQLRNCRLRSGLKDGVTKAMGDAVSRGDVRVSENVCVCLCVLRTSDWH